MQLFRRIQGHRGLELHHGADEVSWLFCLAVSNIAKAVQADVRKFLAAPVG